MDKITVLLVDDHKLLTETWTHMFNADERFWVLGAVNNAEDAYRIVEGMTPRIALVDINMSPVNGFEITKNLKEISANTRVIAVSVHNSISYAKKMMQAGARGYVTKNSSKEELFKAIIEVHKGNKYVCGEIKNLLALQLEGDPISHDPNKLTKTELIIINHVREGLSSKEIASKLDLSVKTVEVHRYNILKKLDMKNTAALINYINGKGI
jgi:DNA-binding NarL/FixJ family response regulator